MKDKFRLRINVLQLNIENKILAGSIISLYTRSTFEEIQKVGGF